MTFIPLSYKNFVVNKAKNTISVNYKDSDITTHVSNNKLQSKSLINLNNFNNLTNDECQLNSSDANLIQKKSEIKAFYSAIIEKDLSALEYFESKDRLNAASIYNDNVKDGNFKNYHKIERVEQKFLPNSFELQKKNIVKNSLYNDYKSNFSLDFYKNLNRGFCNYNSINFFSQRFDEDTNHTNCITWPNTKTATGNLYDFFNNDITFSCYLNLRKNYSTVKQPECLLHIPDFVTLYIVKGYGVNTHRLAIVTGINSKKRVKEIKASIFNSSSEDADTNLNTYITSDLNINNNTWYNLCIDFNKNVDNSRDIEIYLDGVSIKRYESNFDRDHAEPINSYICLGNKPDYFKDSIDDFNKEYDEIFYQFFGSKFSENQKNAGPFIDKDVSLGNNSEWSDAGVYNIGDFITAGTAITFEHSIDKNSESFHGEIHDIRIYKQSLSIEKIQYNCANIIGNIATEIEEFDLCFYVPVFYLPVYVNKKSAVNANSKKLNLYYSSLYNPYFSNFCGGLEVSTESYLIDFVNKTKPNIVIGGKEFDNVHSDSNSTSVSSLIDTTSDAASIKKGILCKTLYNSNLKTSLSSGEQIHAHCNLSYRNLMILPNDNGIPKVSFTIISEALDNIEHDKSKLDLDNLHNVSIENIINESDFHSNMNYSLFNESSTINSFEIKLENNSDYDFDFTNDALYNVSNIIYHDSRINNVSEIAASIDSVIFNNKLANIRDIFTVSDSNPVIRDYKQSPNDFNISGLSYVKTIKTWNDAELKYFKLPISYASANKDFDCLFNTIFDVSSKLYNKKINKSTFSIKDSSISTSNSNVSLRFADDMYGILYRNDCLSKQAKWNYVGHLFYKEGIISLNRPELSYFGETDFECNFSSDFSMFVHEINIPAEAGMLNTSVNSTFNKDLRHDESAFNSESPFVYITDINLHDENLNVIAKAKLARPAPKKYEDNILFKLKMDY